MKMNRLLIILCLLSVLAMSGCSTTKSMVGDIATDELLSLPEKFEALEFPQATMTYPIVYQDGPVWRDRLYELVSQAEDYIILTSFLASECDENQMIYDMLCEKAEAGVDVWLLMDGMSSFDMTESRYHMRTLNRLAEHGVKLFEFNPVSITRLPYVASFILREHRKIVLIDGVTAVVGGMNINYISMGDATSAAMGQRDMMFEVVSPQLCAFIEQDFIKVWNSLSWEEIPLDRFDAVDRSSASLDSSVSAWYVNQVHGDMTMASMFGSLLYSAQESVLMLPFLPYSDTSMLKALGDAHDRGVEVTMIMPFDSRASNRKASQYMVKDLLETGIDVRRENEVDEHLPLLHEKLMVVDGRYTVIGSSNFNFRSMNLAAEVMLVVDDEAFAKQMTGHFENRMETTSSITAQEAAAWRNLSAFFSFLIGFYGG